MKQVAGTLNAAWNGCLTQSRFGFFLASLLASTGPVLVVLVQPSTFGIFQGLRALLVYRNPGQLPVISATEAQLLLTILRERANTKVV